MAELDSGGQGAARPGAYYLVGALATAALLLLGACGGGGGSGGGGTATQTTPTGAANNSSPAAVWTIPAAQVVDGGPGKDGIPSVDNPTYVAADAEPPGDDVLVVGFLDASGPRAISHEILDWHEVVNDNLDGRPAVINYCPLTGSAMLWEGSTQAANPTFGVSGLLYNSNLILYDRETDSLWSQMRRESVNGDRVREVPPMRTVVESTWAAWRSMYPDTRLMSRVTGFSRDYGRYPYGDFRSSERLIFGVSGQDSRLHAKTRVLGISASGTARAYPVSDLGALSVINDDVNGTPVVVAGSASGRYAVAFSRLLADGTELTFEAVDDAGATILRDNEGGHWDVFGRASSGPHAGETLSGVDAYVAYWFAWAAFNPGSEIHVR